jgi:hypothetical protein
MKIKEQKEKYISILVKLYRAFNPIRVSVKVKILLAILAIIISLGITFLKIALR